jgi:hypothetical protein
MTTLHSFTSDSLEAWQSWFDRLDGASPYHSPTYLSTLAGDFEQPAETAKAVVLETEDGFVYYPYLERPLSTLPYAEDADVDTAGYSDIVSSWYYGGPLVQTHADGDPAALAEQFADAFDDYCRKQNVVAEFVRFDPNRENHRTFEALDPAFNRETVPVDLTGSDDDVWNGYEDRNQRAIKQAWDTEIRVEPTREPSDVAAFHDIYSNAMAARDAAEHYRFSESFFASLLDQPDLASLLVARYEGSVIGGFIILHDDRVGHHYLSASNPDYWDMRVNNLLYHEVVMYAKETGRELFDFQGGRPGVFKFKKGFSPDRGEFYVGKRTHLPEVYDDLVAAADRTGVDTDTGYFPAYRVEQSN